MATIIRHAHADDAVAIAEIYNHAVRDTTGTWDEDEVTPESQRAVLAALREGECILVAEAGGTVAGWISLTRVNEKSGWRFTRSESVYVHPEHRRQGLGRALLDAVLAEARSYGMRSVIALVSSDNDVSLALHEQAGFVVRGELEDAGFKFGRWLNLTYMQCLLEPAAGDAADTPSQRPVR